MSTRTVRLDDEAEEILKEIRDITGLSISDALKQGLISYRETALKTCQDKPYDIFKELDLGPGGYALGQSTEVKEVVKQKIRNKLSK